MKKTLLALTLLLGMGSTMAQSYSSSATSLGSTGMTAKIDTNATTVTLTLTGPSTSYLAIGFGGTSMSAVSDLFIWNASSSRDYSLSGYSAPTADATQNWTVTSDTVSGSTRTVVATRALSASGNYTFTNAAANISVIYAKGSSTSIAQHASSNKGSATITTTLGNDDFSKLTAAAIFPNPSTGIFNIETPISLSKINVYSQIGTFIKTISIEDQNAQRAINLSDLSSGIYMLELESKDSKVWKKIIKE
ncbi:T9SS type A sorting domain-containing protein [Flavobacterium branchiophilum]|uniref:Secretion protein n=1 Tax=Flavobacterium branchiophilum TaxID=55197 RepID=A0A2H3KXB5_9FLAO|nr:T9SS type A sorting domain-containing protein [Flavobacterium branchiophilum]PDS24030.1 secretion protein [Flavobacterium branchiophilum]